MTLMHCVAELSPLELCDFCVSVLKELYRNVIMNQELPNCFWLDRSTDKGLVGGGYLVPFVIDLVLDWSKLKAVTVADEKICY